MKRQFQRHSNLLLPVQEVDLGGDAEDVVGGAPTRRSWTARGARPRGPRAAGAAARPTGRRCPPPRASARAIGAGVGAGVVVLVLRFGAYRRPGGARPLSIISRHLHHCDRGASRVIDAELHGAVAAPLFNAGAHVIRVQIDSAQRRRLAIVCTTTWSTPPLWRTPAP